MMSRQRLSTADLVNLDHQATEKNNKVNGRKAILDLIIDRIMKLQPSLDKEKAFALARKIDSILYQSAPSFEIYADELTFDERLTKIATQIIIASRRRTSAHHFAGVRRKLLRKKVGDTVYKEIMNIVKEITEIRETSNIWTAVIQKKVVTNDGSSSCYTASELIPPGLRGIYFGSRLVVATAHLVAKTSSLEPERVDKLDWEKMLEEARENVASFRKFEADTKASIGEGIRPCTSFGCCFARYPQKTTNR
eukprot:5377578-Ditylum_brightwellii.AAC.1